MGLCICINSIWWVMMKWVSTRRGFSEAEDQTVCAVWYLCVGPTVLPEIIGLLICPRVTVFLTDLLLEGTAEDEMKTLHLKINVYHQKHRSNLVIYFFPYGCMEKSDTSYIALRMYLWHTLIVNWIIQAEYLTIAQVSLFYEPPSVNIDCSLSKCGITANPSLENFSSTEPELLFGSSCHS